MDSMKKIFATTLLSLLALTAFAAKPVRHLDQIKATPVVHVDKAAGVVS